MTEQEIKQLKVIALNTAQGNVANAMTIYKWLIEKTDKDGAPVDTAQDFQVPQELIKNA